jgi:hypothetical protein
VQRNRVVAVVVIIALVAVLALILYGVCGGTPDTLACVRDVAIIVLVLETFVVTMLLGIIVLLFGEFINTVQTEILPILRQLQQTANTVQGTTRFVADAVVSPIIGLAGFGSAVRGTMLALMRMNRRRSGSRQAPPPTPGTGSE